MVSFICKERKEKKREIADVDFRTTAIGKKKRENLKNNERIAGKRFRKEKKREKKKRNLVKIEKLLNQVLALKNLKCICI